jgi:hypothetical protein
LLHCLRHVTTFNEDDVQRTGLGNREGNGAQDSDATLLEPFICQCMFSFLFLFFY